MGPLQLESAQVISDSSLLEAIQGSLQSSDVSYHYALPTQLIAKFVDPDLDATCIQAQRGGPGAFDARTIAHQVIVPFDKANYNVLGGSPSPYLNNPLRIPEFTMKSVVRRKKKDKKGWDNTVAVLQTVQNSDSAELTASVLRQTQIEIARLLQTVRVTYPVPQRISLETAIEILRKFLSVGSGGDRPQAVATALLITVGKQFNIFENVRRRRTTAADAASGQVADIECLDANGAIVLAAEVKDTQLEISHIEEKLPRVREESVSELIYLVREGIAEGAATTVKEKVRREFTSGQNIYVFDLLTFAESMLALLGEKGRTAFIVEIGSVLDAYGSPITTKRDWAKLLLDA